MDEDHTRIVAAEIVTDWLEALNPAARQVLSTHDIESLQESVEGGLTDLYEAGRDEGDA